jgi:hypothetical protein
MNRGKTTILDERFYSGSPAASWTQYLVLERLEDGKFKLDIRAYELLAEASEYYDEEKDDWNLPGQIDGKDVMGVEDEYVIGGDLLENSYDTEFDTRIVFTLPDQDILEGWLKKIGWFDDNILKSLMKECGDK